MSYLDRVKSVRMDIIKHIALSGIENIPDNTYVLYVDGSYETKDKKAGWGFVAIVNNKLMFADYGNVDDEHLGARNITGECASALKALEWLDSIGVANATIVHDYKGLGQWASNLWQAKSPVAKKYKKKVEETKVQVCWRHIKGHNGNEWNECVDVLAELGKLKPTEVYL